MYTPLVDFRVVLMACQVNKMMASVSNRRARTKDWASDGRKVARIVFESLEGHSAAVQSFALLILAGEIQSPDSTPQSRTSGLTLVESQCHPRWVAQSRPLPLVERTLPCLVHANSGGKPGEVENVGRRWLLGL
jgi:hypothetical protein